MYQLGCRAFDFNIPEDFAKETTHEIRERIQVVEPVTPEGLHLGVGYHDTAETNHSCADNDWVENGSEVFIRRICCNALTN